MRPKAMPAREARGKGRERHRKWREYYRNGGKVFTGRRSLAPGGTASLLANLSLESDQAPLFLMEEATEVEDEANTAHHDSNSNKVVLPSLVPHVGMEFRNSDEAWSFWLTYSGQKGFEARKRYTNKRPSDGKVTSCRFVCANEGLRSQDKRDYLTKCPRAETRTDCQVHMNLKTDQKKENLKVSDLVLEHNHPLHLPETLHLMVSQRKISELQAFEIETADDVGIGPKAAHELASRQVGGPLNLSCTLRDHKNYLRTKRQREMKYGQAGSMLKYFQDKIAENPSFQYALQMDCEEQIANIFWECYMKDIFTLGMRSTQLSESLNNDLKIHFKSDFDIIRFFKHFERVVQGKRNNELNSEFDSRKKLPKLFMRRPPPILVQASKLYTPCIFEAFQGEYEISLSAGTKAVDGCNEYLVGDFTFEEEYKVIGDPLKQTVECSCRQFDRIGILCGHALKILDLMNIKSLPAHYVLKRWTREARSGTVQDNMGRNIIANPNMDAILGYRYMSLKFQNLAHRAANFQECIVLVDSTLDILGKQIEEKINACTSTSGFPCTNPTNASPPNDLLANARLKKKEIETKSAKRKRTWLEKKHKARKKRENKTASLFEEEKKQEVGEEACSGVGQVADVIVHKDNMKKCQDFKDNLSFTQLLMGPITDDLFTGSW